MAREIIRQQSPDEPGERSILWRDEDSFDVLKEDTGTKAVEGLILDMENINEESHASFDTSASNSRQQRFCEELSGTSMSSQDGDLNADAFSSMRNLAIIKLNHVRLIGSCKRFSTKLVWIQWQNYPFESLPSYLTLNKLVVLDMEQSNLKRVWDGYKVLESLKVLNLSYSRALEQTPDFKGLPKLEKLILKGCTSLATLCESIGILERLASLNIEDCKNLRAIPSLPNSILELNMSGCTSLTTISDSIGDLKGLVLLNMEECKNLRAIPCLPNSILELKMSGCTGLGESRMELKGEDELFSLDNRMVPTVARPVTTLGFLPGSIVKLSLDRCNLSNNSFPYDGSWLSSLTDLNIRENLITELPNFVGSLPSVQVLRVDDCPNLQSLLFPPTTLTTLDAYGSHSFKVLKLTPRFNITNCSTLLSSTCLEELVGCFKWVPKEMVEKQVLRSLGFMMPFRKVLYEYGIYSMCVMGDTDKDVLGYLSWREIGSSISITVPFSNYPSKNIVGFNVSFTFTDVPLLWISLVEVSVSNRTKDVNWIYVLAHNSDFKTPMDVHWLSMWKCGDFLQPGDQLAVTIKTPQRTTVKECGIRIVYDEDLLDDDDGVDTIAITSDEEEFDHPHFQTDDQQKGKQNKTNNMTSSPPTQIRWTDRMLVEISDYCTPGTTHTFSGDHNIRFNQDAGNAYSSEHHHLDWYECAGPWRKRDLDRL